MCLGTERERVMQSWNKDQVSARVISVFGLEFQNIFRILQASVFKT